MPMQANQAAKAYVLESSIFQSTPNGKKICVQHPRIVFDPEPCFHSNLILVEKQDKEHCEQWMLQVKGTALKNERLHLEVTGVRAKAQNSSNGQVVLDLTANPLLDCKVKLGKTVKKVLERDDKGKPRKWLEVMVKEIEQTAMGVRIEAVPGTQLQRYLELSQPPVACPPMAYMAVPPVYETTHFAVPPIMPAPPTTLECLPLPAQDPSSQPWRLRALAEEGKTEIALQQEGALPCDHLEIKLNTGQGRCTDTDALKLTVAGDQIQVDHPWLQASADTISSTGPDGCLVFEGHVHLTYGKDGQQLRVIAGDRVCVDLAAGSIQVQGTGSMPASSDDSAP
jgi:hypothetical protein